MRFSNKAESCLQQLCSKSTKYVKMGCSGEDEFEICLAAFLCFDFGYSFAFRSTTSRVSEFLVYLDNLICSYVLKIR